MLPLLPFCKKPYSSQAQKGEANTGVWEGRLEEMECFKSFRRCVRILKYQKHCREPLHLRHILNPTNSWYSNLSQYFHWLYVWRLAHVNTLWSHHMWNHNTMKSHEKLNHKIRNKEEWRWLSKSPSNRTRDINPGPLSPNPALLLLYHTYSKATSTIVIFP